MRYLFLPVICCLFGTLQSAMGLCSNSVEDDCQEKPIDKAILSLELSSSAKVNISSSSSGKGSHMRYPRFTQLTTKIGELSNRNIQEYQRLISLGLPRFYVLAILRYRKHESCFRPIKICSPWFKYRTIDGTCNNVANAFWGSAPSTFRRLHPPQYSDGFNSPKGFSPQKPLPNARLVSTTVHMDKIQPDPTLTNMVPQIGQFLDHDFALTIEDDRPCCTTDKGHKDCYNIDIPQNDYFYSNVSTPQRCMDFTRSTAYCFPTETGVREQFNIDTAYVDASQVYGSDNERAKHLREFKGGRLMMNLENPQLIVTVKEVEEKYKTKIEFMGKFLAGDNRVNEMPALTTLHVLWVREHNRISDLISDAQPSWNDQQIYEEARRIVVAEWQNVVYGQFLTVVLGEATMKRYQLDLGDESAFSTYNPAMDATLFHNFATAAYRFGHTLLNGLIRLVRNLDIVGSYLVRDNYFNSTQIERDGAEGYNLILGGLMTQNSQTYDRFVSVDFTNFLFKTAEHDFGADLIARNIQRSRDHAIPNYTEFRKVCGLDLLTSWNKRPKEILPETWDKLRLVYESPSDIELFPGGISELPMQGAVTGPTFNCLKALQFYRLKFGDRFFFTHSNQAGSFNSIQLEQIRRRTLGDIICENSQIIKTTQNVFRTASNDKNPWINCNDASRTRLNIKDFV